MEDEILKIETEFGVMCFKRMGDSVHARWCFEHGVRLDMNNVAHVGEFQGKPFYEQLRQWLLAPFRKQSEKN